MKSNDALKNGEAVSIEQYAAEGGKIGAGIQTVRNAVKRNGIDPNKLKVKDFPAEICAQTHRKVIYLNRKRLQNSTQAEIDHDLAHEQQHCEGIYNEGVVELSIAEKNKTGKIFYKNEQQRVNEVIQILGPTDGLQKIVTLYKQKKIQQLYRTFLFAAAKKKISQSRAKRIFFRGFPELKPYINQKDTQPKAANDNMPMPSVPFHSHDTLDKAA